MNYYSRFRKHTGADFSEETFDSVMRRMTEGMSHEVAYMQLVNWWEALPLDFDCELSQLPLLYRPERVWVCLLWHEKNS